MSGKRIQRKRGTTTLLELLVEFHELQRRCAALEMSLLKMIESKIAPEFAGELATPQRGRWSRLDDSIVKDEMRDRIERELNLKKAKP